jgi:hypothetical protein
VIAAQAEGRPRLVRATASRQGRQRALDAAGRQGAFAGVDRREAVEHGDALRRVVGRPAARPRRATRRRARSGPRTVGCLPSKGDRDSDVGCRVTSGSKGRRKKVSMPAKYGTSGSWRGWLTAHLLSLPTTEQHLRRPGGGSRLLAARRTFRPPLCRTRARHHAARLDSRAPRPASDGSVVSQTTDRYDESRLDCTPSIGPSGPA